MTIYSTCFTNRELAKNLEDEKYSGLSLFTDKAAKYSLGHNRNNLFIAPTKHS